MPGNFDDVNGGNEPKTIPTDAPEEQLVKQQLIPFLGDELAAAMTSGGVIYVTFPGMCLALGLSVEGQLQRIRRTQALRMALRRIPLETRGGRQTINCLRVDKLALWLAGVDTARIKPQYRSKIEAYQDELAPLATQVFMRVLGIQPAPPAATAEASTKQIAEIAEQLDTMMGVVAFLREHLDAQLAETSEQIGALSLKLDDAVNLLESLATRQASADTRIARIDERTQRLTPAHARAMQEQVDRMVHDTRRLPAPLSYPVIYGRLKQRFRVSSYREISDDQYEGVMTWLREEQRRALAGEAPEQGNLF